MQLQDLGDRATEGPQQKADHNKKLPSHGLAHLVVFFLPRLDKIIESVFDHCKVDGREISVGTEGVVDFDEVMQ